MLSKESFTKKHPFFTGVVLLFTLYITLILFLGTLGEAHDNYKFMRTYHDILVFPFTIYDYLDIGKMPCATKKYGASDLLPNRMPYYTELCVKYARGWQQNTAMIIYIASWFTFPAIGLVLDKIFVRKKTS